MERDPLALLMMAVAAVVGFGAYVWAFRFGLEEGLRNRKSPNQVRSAAAAAGLLLFGVIGFFISWGVMVLAPVIVIVAALLILARGVQRPTLVLITLAVLLTLAALFTHRGHRPHTQPPSQTPAAATEDAVHTPLESPSGNLLQPTIKPIAPKEDSGGLIKSPATPKP